MDFFSAEEADNLLGLLWELTDSSLLEWKQAGQFDYMARNRNFIFHLYPKDDDGLPPFALQVQRGDKSLDNILQDDSSLSEESANLLHSLFLLVKRKVAGGDRAVSDLLDGLRDLRDQPPF